MNEVNAVSDFVTNTASSFQKITQLLTHPSQLLQGPSQPTGTASAGLKPPGQLFQTQFSKVSGPLGFALPAISFAGGLFQKMGEALEIAREEWDKGVRETPGKPNRGKEVDKYAASVGGIIGETWCGYFLGYCYEKAGLENPIALASTLRAKNFFKEPGSNRQMMDVGESFNPAKSSYTFNTLPVLPGDVVIFNEKGQSHLGMVESYDARSGKLTTIEGNSAGASKKNDGSDTVVIRDGNAVVRKVYDLSLKHMRDQITGFGRPAPEDFTA